MICSYLNSCEPPLSIRFTLPRHHGYFIIVFKLCQIKYLGGLGHHHHHPDHHQLLIRRPACQCCPSTWEWEWRGLSILPPATQTSPGFLFQNVLQGISSNTRGKLCGNATNVCLFFIQGHPCHWNRHGSSSQVHSTTFMFWFYTFSWYQIEKGGV